MKGEVKPISRELLRAQNCPLTKPVTYIQTVAFLLQEPVLSLILPQLDDHALEMAHFVILIAEQAPVNGIVTY